MDIFIGFEPIKKWSLLKDWVHHVCHYVLEGPCDELDIASPELQSAQGCNMILNNIYHKHSFPNFLNIRVTSISLLGSIVDK